MKNPFKVKKGQVWESTDRRPDRGYGSDKIRVEKVSFKNGVAHVVTIDGNGLTWPWLSRPRTIRLDRFSPKHHYRLSA